MPNQYIEENLMLIQSIINFVNDNKLAGIIMFIDFEKAYDLVYWKFHIEYLRNFNCRDKFIKWTKIYNDVHVKVRNISLTIREIPVQKGLKQGYCISCELYLFISKVFYYL